MKQKPNRQNQELNLEYFDYLSKDGISEPSDRTILI